MSSPFAQVAQEYVPPEAAGYQLMEPLLPDQAFQPAASSPVEDWTTNLRVTATNIGSSRFRRTVSVNQMERAASGQQQQQQTDLASVLLGASGPAAPRTGAAPGTTCCTYEQAMLWACNAKHLMLDWRGRVGAEMLGA